MKSREAYETVTVSLGAYLGEVFVRNLQARWHFPNLFQVLSSVFLRNAAKAAERHWYITVGRQKVHVFAAVRAGILRTSDGFSLYSFYLGWDRYMRSFSH